MDPYLTLKWLHILTSTVLFGTGIGTAFQMVMAMKSQDAQVIHRVARHVVIADWLFTTPAGILQPLTGVALAHVAGYSLTESWLLTTYALYVLAFVCWVPVVRLQIRIRDLTAHGTIPDEAKRLYRIWFALGWPAFASLTAIYWLMVAKPDVF
jgi:uncharacterized membrane protein